MKNYHTIFETIRLSQYIKNLLIAGPLFFTLDYNWKNISETFEAFVVFSILASAIYIYNDIKDIENDKKHPIKRNRPIASGKIEKKTAILAFYIMAAIPITYSIVNIGNGNLTIILIIYLAMNIAYSSGLKTIPIIDICIISIGFVLRLYVGSTATGIPLSMWIILVTFLLALFLALAKRRDDVLLYKKKISTRKNIHGYNLEFINASMVMMGTIACISYIFYTISPEIIEKFGTKDLYITSLFVILGVLRYMQITFVEEKTGNPTKIIANDRFIQIIITIWIASFYIIANYKI